MNFVFMFWVLAFFSFILLVTLGSLAYNFYTNDDAIFKKFITYTLACGVFFGVVVSLASLFTGFTNG